VFYVVTSLAWDLFAALGNALLITLFGQPTLRALRRFKRRFESSYVAYQPLEPSPQGNLPSAAAKEIPFTH
jgi:hypothetical protein